MKIGFVISVYDELPILKKSLRVIGDAVPTVVVQSDPGNPDLHLGEGYCLCWLLMPDLASSVERYNEMRKLDVPSDVPARAVTRNYGAGFRRIKDEPVDYIAAILGDVRVTNLHGIESIVVQMKAGGFSVAATRAVGQHFYDEKGELSRFQTSCTTDIMPQCFIVDADIIRLGYFCDIKVTNPYTTEQCLGDEVVRYSRVVGRPFAQVCYAIADEPYPYSIDGISYNPDKAGRKTWRKLRYAVKRVLGTHAMF
jgi:hypothetical protein